MIYGDAMNCYKDRYQIRSVADDLNRYIKTGMPLSHQACIYTSKILKKEKYSLNYRIAGDYEHLVRLVNLSCKIKYVPVCIALTEQNRISIYQYNG